ncbi:carbohydrate kinase [Parabacteroides sp. 52]|uniref:carbohydrate kinase family protein n=1 Tax=unclassified Parabacteroides TaxID=2649774 RepID=UPI0013CF6130|nr:MULTISPECIES: carbohydrate kinase [unclassified Parabacteroides]MDH6534849.1 fructokinase [Parabacteroides sp. PM5-20]NDV55566.1 carbohydrate kinase [Parabacteroides sp. 52]
MTPKKPLVVGIGELLWDVFPDQKKAGGAPINFVYHATQMGAEGCAISAVGNDVSGTEIIMELEKNHINNYIEKVAYPTSSVLVELNNGSPTYTIVEGVAWDYLPLTQQAIELVEKADAICFGTLAQRSPVAHQTISTLLSHAKEETLRFFDINIRQHYYHKELIEASLEKANIFKLNDEELELLRPMFQLEGTDEEVCQWFIRKYNLRYLILTGGSKFSTIYSPEEVSTIPTPRVTVVDTVGAGDSFSGAFVYSILTGKSLREAHQKAVEVAAFVCTRQGAWPAYNF